MGVVTGLRRHAKMKVAKLYINCLRQKPWYRKICTSNYNSGYVALGERNTWLIRDEYVTIDLQDADYRVDFRKKEKLPFPDNSQSVIYSAHMFEHIPHDTVLFILKECFRVLKPGGTVRIEVPDINKIIAAYKNSDCKFMKQHCEVMSTLGDVYGQRHITMIGMISCYKTHRLVPVTASLEEVEHRLASMSVPDFAEWCVSLQTPEQQQTGGHINPLYFTKLADAFSSAGIM